MKKRWIIWISGISALVGVFGFAVGLMIANPNRSLNSRDDVTEQRYRDMAIKQDEIVRYVAIGDSLSAGFNIQNGINLKGNIDKNGRSVGVSYPDFVVNFLQLIQKRKVGSYHNFSLPYTNLEDWYYIISRVTGEQTKSDYSSINLDIASLFEANNPQNIQDNFQNLNHIDKNSYSKVGNIIKNSNLLTISLGMMDFFKHFPLQEVISTYKAHQHEKEFMQNYLFEILDTTNQKVAKDYVALIELIQKINPKININIISYPFPLLKYVPFLNKIFAEIFHVNNGYDRIFESLNNNLRQIAKITQVNYINVFNKDFWMTHVNILTQNFSLDIVPGVKGYKKIAQEIVSKIAVPEELYEDRLNYLNIFQGDAQSLLEKYKKYNPFTKESYFFSDIDSYHKQIYFPQNNELLIKNYVYGARSDEEDYFNSVVENEREFEKNTKMSFPISFLLQDLLEKILADFTSNNSLINSDNLANNGEKYLKIVSFISVGYALLKSAFTPEQVERISKILLPVHLIHYKKAGQLWNTILANNGLLDNILKKFENKINELTTEKISEKTITSALFAATLNTHTIFTIIKNLALLPEDKGFSTLLTSIAKTFISKPFLQLITTQNDESAFVGKLLSILLNENITDEQSKYLEDFFWQFLKNVNLKNEIEKTQNFSQLVGTILKENQNKITNSIWNFVNSWIQNGDNRKNFIKILLSVLTDAEGKKLYSAQLPKESEKLENLIEKLLTSFGGIDLFKHLILNAMQKFTDEQNIEEFWSHSMTLQKFLIKIFDFNNSNTFKIIFEIFENPNVSAEDLFNLLEWTVFKTSGKIDKRSSTPQSSSDNNISSYTQIINFVSSATINFWSGNLNIIKIFRGLLLAINQHKFSDLSKTKIKTFLHMILDKFINKNESIKNFLIDTMSAFLYGQIKNQKLFSMNDVNINKLKIFLHEILINNKILNELITELFFVIMAAERKSNKDEEYSDFFVNLFKEIVAYVRINVPLLVSIVFKNKNIKSFIIEFINNFTKDKKILSILQQKLMNKIMLKLENDITDTELYKLIDNKFFKPINQLSDENFTWNKILRMFLNLFASIFTEITNNLIILVFDFILKNEYISAKLLFDTWEELNNESQSIFEDIKKEINVGSETNENFETEMLDKKMPVIEQEFILKILNYVQTSITESSKYENKLRDIFDQLFKNVIYNYWIQYFLQRVKQLIRTNITDDTIFKVVLEIVDVVATYENFLVLYWILVDNFLNTILQSRKSLNSFISSFLENLANNKQFETWFENITQSISDNKKIGEKIVKIIVDNLRGSWFLYDKNFNLYQTITNAIFGSKVPGIYETAKHKNWIFGFIKKILLSISKEEVFVGQQYLTLNDRLVNNLNLDITTQNFAEGLRVFVTNEVTRRHLSRLIQHLIADKLEKITAEQFEKWISNLT